MTTRAAARARVAGAPVAVWLAGLVTVSALARIALARSIGAPWIMVDELIYSELAKSFAAGGDFLVREHAANGYGVVYPILIAPAWRLYDAVPAAYEAAQVVNAVVMSLAAVPAYLLARRLVTPGASLAAAALAVLVPSMLYTGELMTENAFYPLFLVAALALVLMLERPTRVRQVAVVAVCLLAILTRVQGVALVPAVALAPLLLALGERNRVRSVRSFALLYALLGAVLAAALVVTVGRGRSPLALLGSYRAAAHGGYTIGAALRYVVFHVAELDLYLGVLPFAALLALWFASRRSSLAVRAFAAASFALVGCLVLEVAVFASQPSIARVQERNMFYVAPLALTALLAVATGRAGTTSRRSLGAAALAAGILPVLVPYGRLFTGAAVSDTLAVLPWWSVHDRGVSVGAVRWGVLVASLVAAGALVAGHRRWTIALVATVGLYYVAVSAFALAGRHGMRSASSAARAAGVGDAPRDWIDRAVGRDAAVAVVRSGAATTYATWESELFNRSVDEVYDLGAALPGGLPEATVARRADGMLVRGSTPVRARFALVGGAVDLAGTSVAAAPRVGLRLLRVDGSLTVLSEVRGIYAGDTWSGPSVTYTRVRCTGGRLEVVFESDPQLFRGSQKVTATVGGQVVAHANVAPTGESVLSLPLRPDAREHCRARFRVARTVVPARVVPGSSDERALGVHFLRLSYRDA